jgi:hypothetical protein
VVARALVVGALPMPGPGPARDARHLLGDRWEDATSIEELARRVPQSAAWVLEGVEAPDQLWRAEARWWARVESEGSALATRSVSGEASTVGVFGVLAADAWRVRAALEIAARGGGPMGEEFDAVA